MLTYSCNKGCHQGSSEECNDVHDCKLLWVGDCVEAESCGDSGIDYAFRETIVYMVYRRLIYKLLGDSSVIVEVEVVSDFLERDRP